MPLIFAIALLAISAGAVVYFRRNSPTNAENEKMGNPDATFYSVNDLITGINSLDEMAGFVSSAGLRKGWLLSECRAFMAILRNEGNKPDAIGDRTLPGGPSIGRGQVYLATAKAYGLWQWDGEGDERQAYASLVSDEERVNQMAVEVFDRKLSENNHNLPLSIERYNGSGQAARNYRDRALSFISETWK